MQFRKLGGATAVAAVAAVAFAATVTPASADKVADFYKGRDLQVINPYSVGGSYGSYVQLLGEHWGKHIPGKPNVVMLQKRGGGGIRGSNYLYNNAAHDGSVVGILPDALAVTQLLFPKRAKFDAGKMSYIGRLTPVNPMVMIRGNHKVKTIQEAMKHEVIIGCSGKGSQGYIMPRAMKVLLGVKFRQVCGYSGSAPQTLAIDRGDLDAQSSAWASWKIRRYDQIKAGKLVPLVQVGLKREADWPKIPLMQDLTDDKDKKTILRFLSVGGAVGRSVIAPQDVPKDRLQALRVAFKKFIEDPATKASAKKRRQNLDYMSGEELNKITKEALSTPKGLIEVARAAMKGKVEKCVKNCVKKKKKKKKK